MLRLCLYSSNPGINPPLACGPLGLSENHIGGMEGQESTWNHSVDTSYNSLISKPLTGGSNS